MGKNIKVGDLAYIYRSAACCGANNDIGKIGQIAAIHRVTLWCTKCWTAYTGMYATWTSSPVDTYPIYMLKPIDGLSQDEKLEESIFHPYGEHARVTEEAAKPSRPVPQKV